VIEPGGSWTARFGPLDPATLPAMLMVRLSIGGDPGRLGGSPPGVFRLAASAVQPSSFAATSGSSAGASPTPSPTLAPAPAPAPTPVPTPAPTSAVAGSFALTNTSALLNAITHVTGAPS